MRLLKAWARGNWKPLEFVVQLGMEKLKTMDSFELRNSTPSKILEKITISYTGRCMRDKQLQKMEHDLRVHNEGKWPIHCVLKHLKCICC